MAFTHSDALRVAAQAFQAAADSLDGRCDRLAPATSASPPEAPTVPVAPPSAAASSPPPHKRRRSVQVVAVSSAPGLAAPPGPGTAEAARPHRVPAPAALRR